MKEQSNAESAVDYTYIDRERKRGKREKKKYDYGCEMLGNFASRFTK